MSDTLVDVAAAAAELRKQVPAPAAERLAEPPPVPGTAECPLGHRQPEATRFCAECGLPMSEIRLAQRVDLEAVRVAVQAGAQNPETRALQEKQHAEAMAANLRVEQELPGLADVQDPSERKILIHFVEDGFTWKKVWLRGEQLELGPDHPFWESAQSWIRLSKQEQFQRYGRVFFDYGPFPGRSVAPGTEVPLSTAATAMWAEARGGLPARPSGENDGSLIPL